MIRLRIERAGAACEGLTVTNRLQNRSHGDEAPCWPRRGVAWGHDREPRRAKGYQRPGTGTNPTEVPLTAAIRRPDSTSALQQAGRDRHAARGVGEPPGPADPAREAFEPEACPEQRRHRLAGRARHPDPERAAGRDRPEQ